MLQKKEETELSKAITTAETRIIEDAKSSGNPIFPQKKLILTGSILLGLLLPIFFIFALALFETTINTEEILKSITTIPLLGRIPHTKETEKLFINKGERSAASEMFRFLRTSLNYINIDNDKSM